MGMSMDINDALFRHLNTAKIAKEYRESKCSTLTLKSKNTL